MPMQASSANVYRLREYDAGGILVTHLDVFVVAIAYLRPQELDRVIGGIELAL